MLDEDDAYDATDGRGQAKSARHEFGSEMPEQMLAERLAALSERSTVPPMHAMSGGAGRTRGLGRGASSADRGEGRGPGAGSSSPAQDEADPQFPQCVAGAAGGLWRAAAAGDCAGLCRSLRQGGAASLDVGDPADAGATALMKAARAGAVESVMQLVRAGADTEARDLRGETAMHAAAARGHAHVIDALVAAGASGAGAAARGAAVWPCPCAWPGGGRLVLSRRCAAHGLGGGWRYRYSDILSLSFRHAPPYDSTGIV